MALQLFLTDEPDCAQWAYGQASDFLRSVVDHTNFTATYDIRRTFPDTNSSVAFQPGLVGEGLIVDPNMGVIYLIRNGMLRLIAGVYGVRGDRDGQGSQALIGAGGLQGVTWGAARNSLGHWFYTDSRNNKIKRLIEQFDGNWGLSTFASVNFPNTIGVDPSDNVWTIEGGLLKKFAPNGTLTANYSLPAPTIISLGIISNGHIIMITRNNAWDIIYDFNPATGLTSRIAGMNDAEVAAYQSTHGGTIVVDGAAIGEATFHSVGLAAVNSDASLILTGGGDERQVRKVAGGRVSSLFPDGIYYETQDRLTSSTNNDPSRPFFTISVGGLQDNGYPWAFPFTFIPQGGLKSVKAITPVEIGNPGIIDAAQFVSQSIPLAMNAGQQYSVTITMKNTGTTTWSEAGLYRLGSENPTDNDTWTWPSPGRAFITGTVAPAANYAFTFTVTAPAAGGFYNFQARMVREGVNHFGAFTANVTVEVTSTPTPTVIPVTISIKL